MIYNLHMTGPGLGVGQCPYGRLSVWGQRFPREGGQCIIRIRPRDPNDADGGFTTPGRRAATHSIKKMGLNLFKFGFHTLKAVTYHEPTVL